MDDLDDLPPDDAPRGWAVITVAGRRYGGFASEWDARRWLGDAAGEVMTREEAERRGGHRRGDEDAPP